MNRLSLPATATVAFVSCLLSACSPVRPTSLPDDFRDGAAPAVVTARLPLKSGLLFVASLPERDEVWVAGAFGAAVLSTADHSQRDLSLGATTSSLWPSPDSDVVYAVQPHARRVLALSRTAGDVLWEVRVADLPWQVGATPDGRRLYVTQRDPGGVAVVDTETRTVSPLALPTMKFRPAGMAVSRAGNRVAFATLGEVYILDIATGGWGARFPSRAGGVEFSPDGSILYVFGGALQAVDASNGAVAWSLDLPWRIDGLAVSRDGRTGYARLVDTNGLLSIDLARGRVCHRRTLAGLVRRLVLAESDRRLYLTTGADDIIVVDAEEFRCN